VSIIYYSLIELIEFLESNPKKNDIEKYYLDKILIHTKDSINEILEHNLTVLKNQLKKSNSNLLIKKCNRIKNILKKYEVN
tara:strand:+ start:287 stop:529 length:243 start_codon:yes stop_codon:yes gene_type:complete